MHKKRLKNSAVTLTFTLLLAPGLQIGRAQTAAVKMRYLLTEKDGLILNRAEVLAAADVREARWSPDGTYALALREATAFVESNQAPAPSNVSLSVWYSSSRRVQTLWSGKLFLHASEQSLFWLPGTGTALARISGFEADGRVANRVIWLDPAQGKSREIPLASNERLAVSPMESLAVVGPLNTLDNGKSVFRILRSDGSIKETLPLPAGQGYLFGNWLNEGKRFFVSRNEVHANPDKPNEQTVTIVSYGLNPATGEWTPIKNAEAEAQSPAPVQNPAEAQKPDALERDRALRPQVRVVRGSGMVQQDDTKQVVHPVWLETGEKENLNRVLLAADCEDAQLSPKGDAVLYRMQGTAFIVPLSHIPTATLVQALRTTVISNAKQVGLGIIMYVQDYDERFPLASFSISDVVGPYVKNPSLFDGFVYNFPGEELAKIEKPADTILGTIAGPGGEAVIYADGHVKWRDKK